MYKAYKYRIYPTSEQETLLAKSFGCARWFWNYALNLCQETYKNTGKGLSRGYIQGLLTTLKKEYEWLKDPYSQCLQVVALNLSTAYKNFFDKRARLPRFKSKHSRQSIGYPQNVKFDGDYINLPVYWISTLSASPKLWGWYQNCHCVSKPWWKIFCFRSSWRWQS